MTAIAGGAVRRLGPTALVALVFTAPLAPVDDAVAVSGAARVARRGCDAVRVDTLFAEIVGVAPVLSSAVAARATESSTNLLIQQLPTTSSITPRSLCSRYNNEVVAYLAVIHVLGEIFARPRQFVVV